MSIPDRTLMQRPVLRIKRTFSKGQDKNDDRSGRELRMVTHLSRTACGTQGHCDYGITHSPLAGRGPRVGVWHKREKFSYGSVLHLGRGHPLATEVPPCV